MYNKDSIVSSALHGVFIHSATLDHLYVPEPSGVVHSNNDRLIDIIFHLQKHLSHAFKHGDKLVI